MLTNREKPKAAYFYSLTFIPDKIPLADLQPNNNLLSDKELKKLNAIVKAILSAATSFPVKVRIKKATGLPYDIILIAESAEHYDTYTIYRGHKTNSHLGEGGFGYVKLTQHTKTREVIPLKITPKNHDKPDKEFKALNAIGLGIQYLIHNVDASKNNNYFLNRDHNKGKTNLIYPSQTNILMKLAPGEPIFDIQKLPFSTLSLEKRIEICNKILDAYDIFIKKELVHCDLSSKNIFYSFTTNEALIIDAGATKNKSFFSNEAKGQLTLTKDFAAPELLNTKNIKKAHYSEKTDTYALGEVCKQLLNLDANDAPTDEKNKNLIIELNNILNAMQNPNPDKRWNFTAAKEQFIKIRGKNQNLISDFIKTIAIISVDEILDLLKKEEQTNVPVSSATKKEVSHEKKKKGFFSSILTYLDPEEESDSKSDDIKSSLEQPKEEMSLTKFVSILKLFDLIQLRDNKLRSHKEYTQIIRALQKFDLKVEYRSVAVTEETEINNIYSAFIANERLTQSKLRKYFLVSANNEILQIKDPNPTLPIISVAPSEDENKLNKLIHQQSYQEVLLKYCDINANLRKLRDSYQTCATLDSSIKQACCEKISTLLTTLDKQFDEQNLSFEKANELFTRLMVELSDLRKKNAAPSESYSKKSFSTFAQPPADPLQTDTKIQEIKQSIDTFRINFH